MDHIITEHWKAIVIFLAVQQIVSTMPTPCVNGNPCNWYYKWIFQCFHGLTFLWARLFALYNPVFAKVTSSVEYKKDEPTPPEPLHNSSGVLDKL